jgi:hypothetical protein
MKFYISFFFSIALVSIEGQTSIKGVDPTADAKKLLEKNLKNERLMLLSDLDLESKEYFLKLPEHKDPGLVCGLFVNNKDFYCAALILGVENSNTTKKMIFFKNDKVIKFSYDVVEVYSAKKSQNTNIFLLYKKNQLSPIEEKALIHLLCPVTEYKG